MINVGRGWPVDRLGIMPPDRQGAESEIRLNARLVLVDDDIDPQREGAGANHRIERGPDDPRSSNPFSPSVERGLRGMSP
jgi:hypothetical protein